MLVWWQKSGYEINYSHFFRGGWRGVLQWCNVRAHTHTHTNISACTTDFRPTLTKQSTSADLRQQRLTSFCAVCGVLFYSKRESTVVSSGVRDLTLATYICSHSCVCLQSFVTKPGIVMHHREPECRAKKTGFYLQGQGHNVRLYNQNMTVSAISFISSKPVSLLQPNSIWV